MLSVHRVVPSHATARSFSVSAVSAFKYLRPMQISGSYPCVYTNGPGRGKECKLPLMPYKAMEGVMKKDISKKKSVFRNPAVGGAYISLKTAIESASCTKVPMTNRVIRLNKIFMGYITEILSTNAIGDELSAFNVQFTTVNINADCSHAIVFWVPSGSDSDAEIEKILKRIENPLRQELTYLGFVGIVPKITFKKDKHAMLIAEVDRRLKLADFGENYAPGLPEDREKREFQLQLKLSRQTIEQIKKMEEENDLDEDEFHPVPPIVGDIFGLDRNRMLAHMKEDITRKGFQSGPLEPLLEPIRRESTPGRNGEEEVSLWRMWSRRKLKTFMSKNSRDMKAIARERNRLWKLDLMNVRQCDEDEKEDFYDEYLEKFEAQVKDDFADMVEEEGNDFNNAQAKSEASN